MVDGFKILFTDKKSVLQKNRPQANRMTLRLAAEQFIGMSYTSLLLVIDCLEERGRVGLS